MRKEERLTVILEKLRTDGYVKNKELCELFNTSEMTVWRDIEELEEAGVLKRVFGGAIDVKASNFVEVSVKERATENTTAKAEIAEHIVSMLNNNDRVFIDSGSTCYMIAKSLVKYKHRLWCSTNAINTAAELCKNQEIKTIMIGGELKGKSMCSIGHQAETQIKGFSFSISFIACNSIDKDGKVMLLDISERGYKRSIIDASNKCYVVCDSLKIGRNSMIEFANVSEFTGIITDKNIDPYLKKELEGKGAKFILV